MKNVEIGRKVARQEKWKMEEKSNGKMTKNYFGEEKKYELNK